MVRQGWSLANHRSFVAVTKEGRRHKRLAGMAGGPGEVATGGREEMRGRGESIVVKVVGERY